MNNFISIYTIIFLMIGLLGFSISAAGDTYHIYPLNPYNIINLVIYILIIIVIVNRYNKYKLVPIENKTRKNKISTNLVIFIMILNLLLLYGTTYGGYSTWRYSESSISEDTGIIKIIFVQAPAILLGIGLYCMFFVHDVTGLKVRITIALCVIGSFLSSTGIAPMLFVMLITFNFLFPKILRKSIYKEYAHIKIFNFRQNKLKLLLLSLMFIITSIGALTYGISIKTETDINSLIINFDSLVSHYLDITYLIGRFSVNFYSYLTSVEYIRNATELELITNSKSPLQTMLYRFDVIFGSLLDIQRPNDASFSRINYKFVTLHPFNIREGTSPGLFASFTYFCPPPVSYMIFTIFIIALMRLNLAIKTRLIGRLTFFGELVLFFYLADILKSPIDFLIVADDNFIYLFMIILITLYNKKNYSLIKYAK